jgi:hypothetical protein
MSSHDYVIANDTGANVRADLNLALLAIQSQNSGSSEPSTTYAYQFWADTSGTPTLKQRNAANNAWINILTLSTGAPSATELSSDSSPQLGGDLDCNGAQIQWSQGADVASATALAVLTDGNYFDVTGTTTITSINTTGGVGTQIKLHFDGALTLTHHATDLILPGGANITTAAGDEAEFIEYASGDYRCTNYTKATGKAVVGSTAGTSTIWVPAVAMYPTTTAGCDAVAQVETGAGPPPTPELKTLDFADGADKYAQFSIAMPKSWDESTITFQTYWSVAGTNTGTVGFTLSAVSLSSDEVCTTGFGTAVANTPLAASGTISDLMVNAVSGAVTVGGTPAVGDQVFFQVLRDVSEDTQTSPARLHGIKIFFTTDAENDD